MSDRQQAVLVDGVSVRFRPFTESRPTLRQSALSLRRHRKRVEVIALDDVSFSIEKGEAFGIIGGNGAGKSTLLKVMAGTLQPDEGRVIRYGRLSPLLSLGSGFNAALSGRENILLGGLANGLTRAEVEPLTDAIVEFAGLGAAIDRPVSTYSSGMYSRLAFSVAVRLNPEILLLDEVLSVGDQTFREKSMRAMRSMISDAGTIVFVSHSMSSVRELCDRAMWLKDGQIQEIGAVDAVVAAYEGERQAERDKVEDEDLKKRRLQRGRPRTEQRSERGNVLVVAPPSPGSTRLYRQIQAALAEEPSDYLSICRPMDQGQIETALRLAPEQRLLVFTDALTMRSLRIDPTRFTKRLVFVGDPRDTLMETLVRHFTARKDDDAIAAIRQKLIEPESHTIESLLSRLSDADRGQLLDKWKEQASASEGLTAAGDFFPADGATTDSLTTYLEVALPKVATQSVYWPHWATDKDLAVIGDLSPGSIRAPHGDHSGSIEEILEDDRSALEQALDGDPEMLFETGSSLARTGDREGGLRMYRAAIQGHVPAMHALGLMYRDGVLVEHDADRAAFWLSEATRRDSTEAEDDLKALRTN